MKFTPLVASFFALALFLTPVIAQEATTVGDQPAAPAVDVAAPQVPQEVTDFLNDGRALSELSAEELGARAKQARKFSKMNGLPQDLQDQLQAIAQAARAEIAAREEQAAQQKQTSQPAVEPPAPQAPAAEQPAEAAAPQPAEMPAEVVALLGDTRPASELSVDDLNTRAKQARRFAKMDGLPKDVRDQLQAMATAAHDEFVARQEQASQKKQPEKAAVPEQPAVVEAPVVQPPAPAEQPAQQPAEAAPVQPAEMPPEIAKLLGDTRPLSELSGDELTARFKTARQFSKSDSLPEETRSQLAEIAKAARGEMMVRDQQTGQKTPDAPAAPADVTVPPPLPAVIEKAPTAPLPPPPPVVVEAPPVAAPPIVPAPVVDAKQSQQLDGNAGNPAAEAKAKVFLEDPRPAEKLSDTDLRARLDGIRELMAGNELSRQTERDLRKKLKNERDILRDRVALTDAAAQQQAANQQGGQQPKPDKPSKIDKNDYNINIQIVLNDRRPSDELQDYELRRRLEVYRQATYEQQYDQQQREYWRAVMERDQYLLQQRLLRERQQRQAELDAQYQNDQSDIQLDDSDYQPNRGYDDVYAAEVDDQQLEQVLIAPPRKKIARRYTVQEVEASPALRETMPRVEIDTVHFGFNEAFVRAEEVGNLDRIAEIMERILRAHPREVFLIEGHTDAVGSDAANLALSRQRADAIKKALTTYYVIPARNLETVGYGERYLKIPTAEAEQENRRVSVSRATALIGELDE